jgi:hypothetical protein
MYECGACDRGMNSCMNISPGREIAWIDMATIAAALFGVSWQFLCDTEPRGEASLSSPPGPYL